jgi:hypothetical protein
MKKDMLRDLDEGSLAGVVGGKPQPDPWIDPDVLNKPQPQLWIGPYVRFAGSSALVARFDTMNVLGVAVYCPQ